MGSSRKTFRIPECSAFLYFISADYFSAGHSCWQKNDRQKNIGNNNGQQAISRDPNCNHGAVGIDADCDEGR